MKKVFLSLSLLFFGFLTSSVSFASFDCSFTETQLRTLTLQQFAQLPLEKKVELSIIFQVCTSDEEAAKLVRYLPKNTFIALQQFTLGVPQMYNFCSWEERKSARGKILQATLKAIAMGFVKEVPVQVGKQLVGSVI